GADDAVFLHQIDQVRGAAVADTQAALQQRRRGLAELEDELDGVLEELVVLVAFEFACTFRTAAFFLRRGEEGFVVLRLRLLLPKLDAGGDLLLRYERRVHALDAR